MGAHADVELLGWKKSFFYYTSPPAMTDELAQ